MRVTIINGCINNNPLEIQTINKLCDDLNQGGVDYNLINLDKIRLKYCSGCHYCQSIHPGFCCIEDGAKDILKQYLKADNAIIISPIQFGCFNSITKNFIDRTEPLFLPYQVSKKSRIIMKARYKSYPNILFIGIADHTDADTITTFRDTAINCCLATASKKVNVEIITSDNDLNFLLEKLPLT